MSINIADYTNTPPTYRYAVTSTPEYARSSLDQLYLHNFINDVLQEYMWTKRSLELGRLDKKTKEFLPLIFFCCFLFFVFSWQKKTTHFAKNKTWTALIS